MQSQFLAQGGAKTTVSRDGSRLITVGIGEMAVTDDIGSVIITHALGSCIAVVAYDHVRQIGGMIHYMLPTAKNAGDRAKEKPAMYGDVGVPLLFQRLYARGCNKRDLIVKVAGGASLNDSGQLFQIGARNFSILRKLFWQDQILMAAQDVGGNHYRTVSLVVKTGQVLVKTQDGTRDL